MKTSHILIFIVICIVIGAVLFNVDSENKTVPMKETTTEDTGVTENENPSLDVEVSGTDIGMEFPEISEGEDRMFMVNGTNFEFDVKEMRVKKGDTVTIHFMSADGFHDLVIDEFNVRTQKLQKGGMSEVTFVADKAGTFEYYCSVGQHRMNGMVGTFIVEE